MQTSRATAPVRPWTRRTLTGPAAVLTLTVLLATACIPEPISPLVPLPQEAPLQDQAPLADFDACASLRTAAAGSTVVIPSGSWDIGECLVDGSSRPGVTVRGTGATLSGRLQCTGCDRWVFDRVTVVGAAPAADPAYVVRMRGGTGWAWTGCDISNGTDANGTRYGVRGLFTTTDAVRDWRLQGCHIHDNGNSRPGVESNNYDHLLYLNGYNWTSSSNGLVADSTFSNNRYGAPVKIGFGLSNGAPTGIPGVTFTRNRMVNNSSPDGICGVNVAGNSPWTTVSGNTIDCTALPLERTRTAVALRSWVSGNRVTITNNTITGAHNAGRTTACGAAVSGAYDNAITVQSHLPLQGSWQVRVSSCSWNGISSSANTSR